MSNDVVEVTDLVVELFAHADRLSVLLIQQDSKLPYDCEHEVLANPPPKLWVEDRCVLRIGQDHQTVVGKLLGDQGLVAFADMELANIAFHQGLKCLWAQERVCLRKVHARNTAAAAVIDESIGCH